MKCPSCGIVNEEDSKFCSNCGTSLEKKEKVKEEEKKPQRKNKKIILGVSVIGIVVVLVAFFSVLGYDTGEANELVGFANNEITEANTLLDNTISPKLGEFQKVDINVTSNNIDEEIQKITAWKNDASQLKSTVDTISRHLQKAKGFYQETLELRLPDWYYEYIDLKIKALDKDLERMSTMQSLLDNYVVYYGFSEYYLKGETEFVQVMDDLEAGNTKLNQKDFSGAAEMYRNALNNLRDGQIEYASAGDLIDFPYMDDLDEYLEYLDSALDALVDAAEFLGIGDVVQANTILNKATDNLEELSDISEDMLENQLDSWYSTNITGLEQEIAGLAEDVADLEQDATEVYEQNK